MLRDKALIPLSHQHQRALALCVRIDRAQPIRGTDLDAWQSEIQQHFEQEVHFHFAAEEEILFPAAKTFPELSSLTEELIADHARLRAGFVEADFRRMNPESLVGFALDFSTHIRKEERQLFEGLQRLLTPAEMQSLGALIESSLKDAAASCAIPSEATRLKPR